MAQRGLQAHGGPQAGGGSLQWASLVLFALFCTYLLLISPKLSDYKVPLVRSPCPDPGDKVLGNCRAPELKALGCP